MLNLVMETVLPMVLKLMEGQGGPAAMLSSLLGGVAGGGSSKNEANMNMSMTGENIYFF